jgi:glutamate 5-kinase
VGSALLVDGDSGRLNRAWLTTLAQDLVALRKREQQVILVSSGAIALGRRVLKLPPGELKLEESQAAAAVGQIRLAHVYKELLDAHDIDVAQVLLTLEDSEQRRRYLNARATLQTLLRLGAIPVINENDTVATSEIRYGDNDRLAARVAQMAGADCLVLLSDVDGLYTADPNKHPNAKLLPRVTALTSDIEAMAGGSASAVGRGGMTTKLLAAGIAMNAGCHMCIAAGHHNHPLRRIEKESRGTWFVPQSSARSARQQWIAGSLQPAGVLRIDDGARRALRAGKSLLPAGVTSVLGQFERGDTVSIQDAAGAELARGLVAYSHQVAAQVAGRKSTEIAALLGFSGRAEIVHRDDLVMLASD